RRRWSAKGGFCPTAASNGDCGNRHGRDTRLRVWAWLRVSQNPIGTHNGRPDRARTRQRRQLRYPTIDHNRPGILAAFDPPHELRRVSIRRSPLDGGPARPPGVAGPPCGTAPEPTPERGPPPGSLPPTHSRTV